MQEIPGLKLLRGSFTAQNSPLRNINSSHDIIRRTPVKLDEERSGDEQYDPDSTRCDSQGGMMSGMSDQDGSDKLKRMIYIFDSMTQKELDSDGKILVNEPARMTRIACGSGTSVREIEELLTQHRVMAGIAKNMGANKQNMQRAQKMMQGANSKQQAAAMQKRMQSLGQGGRGMPGGGDMASMMKMMQQGGMGGGGGGMPDMSQLMNMFGGGRGRAR